MNDVFLTMFAKSASESWIVLSFWSVSETDWSKSILLHMPVLERYYTAMRYIMQGGFFVMS